MKRIAPGKLTQLVSLAGSTIMLLTLPWFLSIYAGRVDLDEHGKGTSSYAAAKKHQRLVKCEGMTKVHPPTVDSLPSI